MQSKDPSMQQQNQSMQQQEASQAAVWLQVRDKTYSSIA